MRLWIQVVVVMAAAVVSCGYDDDYGSDDDGSDDDGSDDYGSDYYDSDDDGGYGGSALCDICKCQRTGYSISLKEFEGLMCHSCRETCPDTTARAAWSEIIEDSLTLYRLRLQIDQKTPDVASFQNAVLVRTKEYNENALCKKENNKWLRVGYVIKIFYNKSPKIKISLKSSLLFPGSSRNSPFRQSPNSPSRQSRNSRIHPPSGKSQPAVSPETEAVWMPDFGSGDYARVSNPQRLMEGFRPEKFEVAIYSFQPRTIAFAEENQLDALHRYLRDTMRKQPLVRLWKDRGREVKLTQLLRQREIDIAVHIDVVCAARKFKPVYPQVVEKLKNVLHLYAKVPGHQKHIALDGFVKSLNQKVESVYTKRVVELLHKKDVHRCFEFVIAKYFNELRYSVQFEVDGYIPEIGIAHSRIRRLFASMQDVKVARQTPGIEVELLDKKERVAETLKRFYGS